MESLPDNITGCLGENGTERLNQTNDQNTHLDQIGLLIFHQFLQFLTFVIKKRNFTDEHYQLIYDGFVR